MGEPLKPSQGNVAIVEGLPLHWIIKGLRRVYLWERISARSREDQALRPKIGSSILKNLRDMHCPL
jgi:hypothetical protein